MKILVASNAAVAIAIAVLVKRVTDPAPSAADSIQITTMTPLSNVINEPAAPKTITFVDTASTEKVESPAITEKKTQLQELEEKLANIQARKDTQSVYHSLLKNLTYSSGDSREKILSLLADRQIIVADFTAAAEKTGASAEDYSQALAEATSDIDSQLISTVTQSEKTFMSDSLRLGQRFHFARALDSRLQQAGLPLNRDQMIAIVHIMAEACADPITSPLDYPEAVRQIAGNLTTEQQAKFDRFVTQQQAQEQATKLAGDLK